MRTKTGNNAKFLKFVLLGVTLVGYSISTPTCDAAYLFKIMLFSLFKLMEIYLLEFNDVARRREHEWV